MGNKYKNKNVDITNQRFGRLVAISKVGVATWLCKCDCGNEIIVPYSNLELGLQKSCGCWRKECMKSFAESATKHGGTGTVLYRRYCAMIQRCYNPNSFAYHRYGGRGIKVCDEWRNSFEAFRKWAYDNGYDEGENLTLDRINNDEGYSPENCRFATKKEQSLNRERSVVCEYNGVKYTSWDFANKFGITSLYGKDTVVFEKVYDAEGHVAAKHDDIEAISVEDNFVGMTVATLLKGDDRWSDFNEWDNGVGMAVKATVRSFYNRY